MTSVRWDWYLANTADKSRIGLLSAAQNRKINVALDDRESASFSLSLLDRMAPYLQAPSTCVICYRNGVEVWSGPVFTLQKDVPNMIVQVGCIGWFEYLNHWLLETANLGPMGGRLAVSLTTGGAITSLSIQTVRIANPITAGTTLTLSDPTGTNTQPWRLTADVFSGDTVIHVASQVPNFAYPGVDIAPLAPSTLFAPNGGWQTSGVMTSTTLAYTGIDQCAIVSDLMGLYGQSCVATGAPQYVTLGAVPDTLPSGVRNVVYQEYQNLGQAIQTLSQVEYGFDFRVDPVTRQLDMFFDGIWPPTGPPYTVNGRGQVRPDLVFGYHTGPQNIARLTETTDATQLVNEAFAVSQYGTGTYADAGSISTHGIFNEQVQITDSAALQPDILNAYAAVEVLTKSQPLRIWTFDQNPFVAGGSALQPFGVDFDVGDYGWLISDYGVIIPGPGEGVGGKMPVRIFAYTVSVSDQGVETVSSVATTFQATA